MVYLLYVSLALLASTLALVFVEGGRQVRFGGRSRLRIDRTIARAARATGRAGVHTRRFFVRDVLANILHMGTYTALVCVRVVERTLARGAAALRRRARNHK